MKVSLNGSIKKIIWLLMMSSFFITVVYNEFSWSKYAILVVAILVAVLSAFLRSGKIKIYIEPFHIFMLLFSGYILLTSLWAIDAEDAVAKATTVFQIFACATMMYIHYQKEENIHDFLTAVMWAGYLIALYSIWLYGLDYILGAITGNRIRGAYNNANTIGMAISISFMLQMNEILNKRIKWLSLIMLIPAVLVVLATQSRKAMIMIPLGIFLIYVIRNMQSKENTVKTLKLLGGISIMALLLFWALQLPALSTVRERVVSMLNGVLEDGATDGSTSERMDMVRLGISIFKEHPLFGIGIGNAYIVTGQEWGAYKYLHNNYVEVLSGGGIVAFCLYYGMYAYILINLFRYRNADREYFSIGLAWLIMMLILDYGFVSYYMKSQWFYLMIHFLNVRCIKKKCEVLQYES